MFCLVLYKAETWNTDETREEEVISLGNVGVEKDGKAFLEE